MCFPSEPCTRFTTSFPTLSSPLPPPCCPAMLDAFLLIWTAVAEKVKPKEQANKNRNSCNNFAQHGLDFLEFCMFASFFLPLSLSLFLSFSLQLPLPHTPPSVLGPEIEQEILSPSAQPCNSKRRLEFILNNQLQDKQSQGEVETRGMSWESCHQRQVQRFFFSNKNNRAGSQICSFSGCCCQRRACWWWSPQKPFFAFSSVCLHLPLQMEPVLKFLLDCYLQ